MGFWGPRVYIPLVFQTPGEGSPAKLLVEQGAFICAQKSPIHKCHRNFRKRKKKRKLSFWLYMCFFHKCHIPIYKFHIKVEKIPNDGPNGEELYTRCTSHLFPSLPFENFQSAEPKKTSQGVNENGDFLLCF